MQRLTKTSRGCDVDLNLKYRVRHCHTLFVLQIIPRAINLTLSALTYLKYHKFFEVLDIFARNGINKHIYCHEVHQIIFGVILGVGNSNSRQDFSR